MRSRRTGVGIPERKTDEYVVMRLSEMIKEGLVEETIDPTLDTCSGNFGCEASAQSAESLKVLLRQSSIPVAGLPQIDSEVLRGQQHAITKHLLCRRR